MPRCPMQADLDGAVAAELNAAADFHEREGSTNVAQSLREQARQYRAQAEQVEPADTQVNGAREPEQSDRAE